MKNALLHKVGTKGAEEHTAVTETGVTELTYQDVVNKTSILLGTVVMGALVNSGITLYSHKVGAVLGLVGGVGTIVLLVASFFRRRPVTAMIAITISALAGLLIGVAAVAMTLKPTTVAHVSTQWIVPEAVLGTLGVFLTMLYLYRSGTIRISKKFNAVLTAVLLGALTMVSGMSLISLFTGTNPLRDGGALAIGFSIFMITLAALSLLSDFKYAYTLVTAGVDKDHAWDVGLGLTVGLVWLYTEITQLLRISS